MIKQDILYLCGDKLIFEKLSKYIEIALFAKEKRRKRKWKIANIHNWHWWH